MAVYLMWPNPLKNIPVAGHNLLCSKGFAFQEVDLFVKFYLHLKKTLLSTCLSW